MIEAMFAAAMTLAAAGGGQQVAPPVVERPFPSFEGRASVTIDFWCRYEAGGGRRCDAAARDGFDLPEDAGRWLETRTGPRPDLVGTGLRRRVALEFKPGEAQPTAVRDTDRHWEFWWPELTDPVWSIPLESLDPYLSYLPAPPERRTLMTGEIPLQCGVRADGYLDLCIFERPIEEEMETVIANRARAVAANVRLEPAAADGSASAGRFVRLNIVFDGGATLGAEPASENPVTLSQPDPEMMSRLYPPGALEAGVEATVTLECIAQAATGPLENCTVIGEDPGGRGFGPPSVAIAETLVTSPFTIEGRPYRQLVRQRIVWRLH
ncbi:hypothetical protein GGQ87_000005 [Brevundimonas alba]|uniref:TonB C-terminal domain-containing protein n=1 Tax=Brevundimonas alba TaxID=74314 RepID=A0A7X5YGZ8_9CAUL|nr:hypothetical protein [Brevundimonas alba]NJC39747.1 hypothetical protein [Brevundimonas alba]